MKKKLIRIVKYLFCFFTLLVVIIISFFFMPLSTSYLADKTGEHADYYFENEEKWIKNHNLVEIAYYKLWDFKIRKELVDNAHDRFEKQSELSLIRFAVNEVRNASVTQHQQKVPVIFGSSTSCLVRGFGYCDQINSGLSLLLQDKLEQADLYNIYTDSNSHTLVKSKSELGTVWIDAYGCVNVFGFEDELTSQGIKEISLHSPSPKFMFPEKAYREGVFFNSFTFRHSFTKAIDRFQKLLVAKTSNPDQVVVLDRKDSTMPIEIQTRQYNLINAIQTDNKETKGAYLSARIYHLSGEHEKALIYYKIAKEKTVNGLLGMYADSFIKRLEGKEVLCYD